MCVCVCVCVCGGVVQKVLSLILKEEHSWKFLSWQHNTNFVKLWKSEWVFSSLIRSGSMLPLQKMLPYVFLSWWDVERFENLWINIILHKSKYTHTHTYIYIYTCVCGCLCVCVCVCACMCVCECYSTLESELPQKYKRFHRRRLRRWHSDTGKYTWPSRNSSA